MQNVAYTDTVHQPIPPSGKTVQPYSATIANLEKESVQAHCNSCNNEIYTRFNENVSQYGICWAILCCFFGSWLLSLFVLCLDVFYVYRHFCPACNVFIGEYSPKMSGGKIAFLFFLTILLVGLQIFAIMMYLGRSKYGYY